MGETRREREAEREREKGETTFREPTADERMKLTERQLKERERFGSRIAMGVRQIKEEKAPKRSP